MSQIKHLCLLFILALSVWACGETSKAENATEEKPPAQEEAPPPASEAVEKPDAAIMENGESVYNTYCIACHMEDGGGVPMMNPPLIGTEWVTGDKERLIGIILNGMTDPIEIDGETYASVMPPHNFINDEDIAAVLTFVRNSFTNQASPVTVEEVKAVRAANN